MPGRHCSGEKRNIIFAPSPFPARQRYKSSTSGFALSFPPQHRCIRFPNYGSAINLPFPYPPRFPSTTSGSRFASKQLVPATKHLVTKPRAKCKHGTGNNRFILKRRSLIFRLNIPYDNGPGKPGRSIPHLSPIAEIHSLPSIRYDDRPPPTWQWVAKSVPSFLHQQLVLDLAEPFLPAIFCIDISLFNALHKK